MRYPCSLLVYRRRQYRYSARGCRHTPHLWRRLRVFISSRLKTSISSDLFHSHRRLPTRHPCLHHHSLYCLPLSISLCLPMTVTHKMPLLPDLEHTSPPPPPTCHHLPSPTPTQLPDSSHSPSPSTNHNLPTTAHLPASSHSSTAPINQHLTITPPV